MGTRSNIGVIAADGSVNVIYCHWDGYPEDNGRLLLTHHNSEEAAWELIQPGDLSSLGERVNPVGPHTFDRPEKGTCNYYGRDRGETGTEFKNVPDRDAAHQQEYCYLWSPADGGWIWTGRGTPWKKLTPEDCER